MMSFIYLFITGWWYEKKQSCWQILLCRYYCESRKISTWSETLRRWSSIEVSIDYFLQKPIGNLCINRIIHLGIINHLWINPLYLLLDCLIKTLFNNRRSILFVCDKCKKNKQFSNQYSIPIKTWFFFFPLIIYLVPTVISLD